MKHQIINLKNNPIHGSFVFHHKDFIISASSINNIYECDSIVVIFDGNIIMSFKSIADSVYYVDHLYQKFDNILKEKCKYIIKNLTDNGICLNKTTQDIIEKDLYLSLFSSFLITDDFNVIIEKLFLNNNIYSNSLMKQIIKKLLIEIINNYFNSIE